MYESYFLTFFKKSNSRGIYICTDELVDFFKTAKNPSKRMIFRHQSHLARMSCEFIRNISLELNINEKNSPNIIFSMLSDNDGRIVYPCFVFSRILFMHMEKTKCTILIVVETINGNNNHKDLILFENGSNQGHLITENNDSIKKEDVCMVIISTRIAATPLLPLELLKKLNYFGLYSILLMNMAAHPQFSGSKLISFANQLVPVTTKLTNTEKAIETEFLALKSKAHQYGFCLTNPSTLLIKHIFMDMVGNQIVLHQNTNEIGVRESIDI